MEAKRKADDEADQNGADGAKRQRTDGDAAKPKPAIDLAKLQKAKLALQKQKELAEKLKKAGLAKPASAAAAAAAAPAAAPAAPAGAAGLPLAPQPGGALPSLSLAAATVAALSGLVAPPPAAKKAKLPPPLLLDDQGRELDPLTGQPKEAAAPAPGPAPAPAPALAVAAPAEQEKQEDDARFFDPGIGTRALRRMQRRPRAELRFVEQGRFEKEAEVARLRAKYGDGAVRQLAERKRREAELAAEGLDVNLIPLGARPGAPAAEAGAGEQQEAGETGGAAAAQVPRQEPVPDVEWWDARILADRAAGYGDLGAAALEGREPLPEPALREGRITHLVEHPVLIEPPAEAPPPPPQPLKLTKREVKKLRTQRRMAREKEKQDLIRQGLLEPPPPKVKISNLMRVMGEKATADPTAIEAEVRKQMAERQLAHEDRNLARKLTPAEQREKKLRKLLGETSAEAHTALYKVGSLAHPQLRYKVDINAKENHLTGAAVVADDFSLVVVEGGAKTLRRYEKLMLRRINWAQGAEEEEEEDEAAAGESGQPRERRPNYCHLVWQGVLKQPHFKKFSVQTVHTEAAARKFLSDFGVGHYWDLAANYTPEV